MGYKEDKELFVSGSTGGTVTRINLVCLTALTSYALWTVVVARHGAQTPSWKLASIEFATLIVPLLLALTLLSDHPLALNAVVSTVALGLYALPVPEDVPPLSPMPDKASRAASADARFEVKPFSKPFVTSYRAIMMVMTVICILAVDFPVFPREFAKAETWGTSLMDLGVGSFVFSLGVVSALPLLRQNGTRPYLPTILSSIKKSLPILALGMIRVVMVKGVEYPEHVSEYGVHWNFFFTMAFINIFGTVFERCASSIDMHWVGLAISLGHQMLLTATPLQEWTLLAARTGLVSQNKEGIVSLPGYLAIHLLGLASGLYILPPDPYFFSTHRRLLSPDASPEMKRKYEEKRAKTWRSKPGKLANLLGSYAVVWWTCYLLVRVSGWEVSRRLANMPYVLWIVAFNTSFLFLYLVVHLCASSSIFSSHVLRPEPAARQPPPRSGLGTSPLIFEAINRNGLAVFLIANLLTGLVNVSIETMYATNATSFAILTVYCALIVGIAFALRGKRFKV
ncbi:glucosaminyl-phosphotidylinositol O-acyltransferase [Sporobolomyces koalae]|uniref:glucosaminyl-phosphotidylinositol O-acyltransferase n=1 Tax=Sporobolomyces koalae TaxID=500713 RepID=UPI0031821B15